jgi:hypothetical protein
MPPDDKPDAAVAESPTSAGPVAPEAPEVPGQGEEPTKPVSEREPAPAGVESGAETGEEPPEEQPTTEAAVAQFLERIGEIAESDPEMAQKLYEKLPQELRDSHRGPEAEREELDRERTQREVGDGRRAVLETSQRQMTSAQQTIQKWAKDTADAAAKGAADIRDGKSEGVDLLDEKKLQEDFSGALSAGMGMGSDYASRLAGFAMLDALYSHPSARHLTSEDRTRLKEAAGKPLEDWTKTVFAVGLDAALRSAPEEIRRSERAKAEKDSGLARQLTDAMAAMPSDNGRKLQPSAEPGVSNIEDADAAYLDGKITHEQYAKLREKFGVKSQ